MIGHPDATDLRTPPPARDPWPGTERPARIPEPHRLRAMNAAVRARKAYPGCVGEVLAEACEAYGEFGFLARGDHPLQQLIAQLMTEPVASNIQ